MIDIHPPQHGAMTWRDFLIHMAAICLGLLLAIGLEQTVEFLHHRRQLAEARRNIHAELVDTEYLTRRNLQLMHTIASDLQSDTAILQASLTAAPKPAAKLKYQWSSPAPRRAAWDTAQSNGATALMPSDEVAEYTYLYGISTVAATSALDCFRSIEIGNAISHRSENVQGLTLSEREHLLDITSEALGKVQLAIEFDGILDRNLSRYLSNPAHDPFEHGRSGIPH